MDFFETLGDNRKDGTMKLTFSLTGRNRWAAEHRNEVLERRSNGQWTLGGHGEPDLMLGTHFGHALHAARMVIISKADMERKNG